MDIPKEYKNNQYLAMITDKGQGTPSLRYGRRFNNEVFSDISVAIPDKRDIDNFNKTNKTKKIRWEIEGDIVDENPTLSKKEKETLEKEKNRLAYRLKELKGDDTTKAPGDDYYIFECFSFDWADIEGNIIRTSAGLSIINWGLCDLGNRKPKPPPDPDPDYKRIVSQDDNGGGGNGNNGNGEKNGKTLEKWKYWLIAGLLAIILLFMIKNCQPQANIGGIQLLSSHYIFNHEDSNDTTNFFSRGLFKETSIPDLEKLWEWYAFDQQLGQFNKINQKGPKTGTNLLSLSTDNLTAEKYLIKLTITDQGNKFKMWRKFHEQTVEINIEKRTQQKVEILKEEDGLIPESGIEILEKEKEIETPNEIVEGDAGKQGQGGGGKEGEGSGGKEGEGGGGKEGEGGGGKEGEGSGGKEGEGGGGKEGEGGGGKEGEGGGGKEGEGGGGVPPELQKEGESGKPGKKIIDYKTEYVEEYEVKGYEGWKQKVTFGRENKNENFKIEKIEYIGPDGEVDGKLPPKPSQKKNKSKIA